MAVGICSWIYYDMWMGFVLIRLGCIRVIWGSFIVILWVGDRISLFIGRFGTFGCPFFLLFY